MVLYLHQHRFGTKTKHKDMQNEGKMPHTVSKAELMRALRITNKKTLRARYLTDDVITTVLGMSLEQYNRVKVLDVVKTKALIAFFNLAPDDFAVRPGASRR